MHLEKQWNSQEFFSHDTNLLENLSSDDDPAAVSLAIADPTLPTDDSEGSGDPNPDNIQLSSPLPLESQATIPLSLLEKLTKVLSHDNPHSTADPSSHSETCRGCKFLKRSQWWMSMLPTASAPSHCVL
jgi:hypothetical protein